MMYPACYRKLQLGGNQISTLAVYHYPFGKGYNLRYEFKGRYTMKKAILALASLSFLAVAGTTQAVQSVKLDTPLEIYVTACTTLQKTWDINSSQRKALLTDSEETLNSHCHSVFTATLQLTELGKDSKAFSRICIPSGTSNKQVLDKILVVLKKYGSTPEWKNMQPAIATVVALEVVYQCEAH